MDTLSLKHLWKIQRFTAVVAFIINFIAMLINLFTANNHSGKIINLITTALIMIIPLISFFINKKIIRLIQVITFLLTGTLTNLFAESNRPIGDILFITGVILAYTYRLLNTYSIKTITLTITTMVTIKLASGIILHTTTLVNEITITLFSITLILFLITLVKNELVRYITESLKNDNYIRAGMNITGYAHGLDLGTAINILKTIKRKIAQEDYRNALHFTESLDNFLSIKNKLKEQILFAAHQGRNTAKQDVDIHKNLESILEIILLNKEVFKRITVQKKFHKGRLLISAVPFEIHFILRNLITNSVEAMLRVEKKQQLILKTTRRRSRACLVISDTGPGFDLKHNTAPPGYLPLRSAKGSAGGFGLVHTGMLIKHNNIGLTMYNKCGGGAEVRLFFTIKGA